MINYIVVAMDIKTGKSHRASVEFDTRQEAEVYKYRLEEGLIFTSKEYTFSILEYEA